MVAQAKDYIDDWMNFGSDLPWESLGDNTDWASILGEDIPDWMNFGNDVPWVSPGDTTDWGSLLDGGSGGAGGWLSGLLRMFGGGSGSGGGTGGGSGGGGGMGNLLALLGLLGGGINEASNTEDATDAMIRGNDAAERVIREQMGRSSEPFRPYTTAGAGAVDELAAMPDSALAGKFGALAGRYKPLGSGRGMALGQLAKGR